MSKMEALIEKFNQSIANRPAALDESTIPPLKRAGVLVGIFEDSSDGDLKCLLTVRSSKLRSHGGEVCFPGGKMDEEDIDVIDTAVREAEEEIGLSRDSVRVIGCMTPTLSLHLLHVTPVLAIIPSDFVPMPNAEVQLEEGDVAEVEDVFSVPLSLILKPTAGVHSYQDLHWFLPWRMHSFAYQKWTVWGLTAETLVRLCVLICDADHIFPYDARHPDGSDMEDWFNKVIVLPSLRREATDASQRRGRRK